MADEQWWLKCSAPDVMIELLAAQGTPRKLLLFAIACEERERDSVVFSRSITARCDSLLKQCASGELTLESASRIAARASASSLRWAGSGVLPNYMAGTPYAQKHDERMARLASRESSKQCEFLRDIFGNPFRPVSVDPAWRTTTVLSLAQAIYDERAFERLPILADALKEAGCSNADLLNHCRQPDEHVRGCWVVDLILSKDR